MRIYRIAASDFDGFWIAPSGEIIHVGFASHAEYVFKNPTKFGLTKKEIYEVMENDYLEVVTAMAIKNGAIHISLGPTSATISANSPQLAVQYREKINQIVRNHGIIPKWGMTDKSNYSVTDNTVLVNTTSYLKELPKQKEEINELV